MLQRYLSIPFVGFPAHNFDTVFQLQLTFNSLCWVHGECRSAYWRHYKLSIPFVGFNAWISCACLTITFDFQFPLLGSWNYECSVTPKPIYFQFPLLGSTKEKVIWATSKKDFQFPLLGSEEEVKHLSKGKANFQFPLLGSRLIISIQYSSYS